MPQMNEGGEYRQEPILLEERYPATLHSIEEYERDYGDGPVQKLAWIFKVEAGEDAVDPDVEYEEDFTGVFEVAAHTSLATGDTSNFSKLGFWALAGEDWDYDTDALIGRECIVDVTSYEKKNGMTSNVVEKVRAPKKAKATAGRTRKTEEAKKEEEADFENFPF